jgi:class 3 adenylate cyclase
VKSLGDGFMIAFQSARRALRCAVALQRAFAAHGRSHPEQVIRVRIGLHAGDAVRSDDDFFGKAVVLAARIASQARGGEVLVSPVLLAIADDRELRFDAGREVELKGLVGRHRVHALHWTEG